MKKVYLIGLFYCLIGNAMLFGIDVTFKVNMSYKAQLGHFDPSSDFVDAAGTFNGWGNPGNRLTDADGDLIYELTLDGFSVGDNIEFKFRINGSWSGTEEFPGGGANRTYIVQDQDNIVEYWYSDEIPSGAEPVAGFSSSITSIQEEGFVNYYNESIGDFNQVEWFFEGGDPSYSTDSRPVIKYASEGTYGVSLVISNGEVADTLRYQNYIDVNLRDKTELSWWNETVFYEIFVRSFYDSDGDGIGDFRGIEEKLDYLNDGNPDTNDDLGVKGIWLMPINPSPSYHGYDITDYRGVESDYGTMDDFKSLLAACEERGIKVIIDFVMNHSSTQHPWFEDSRSSVNAEKRDWYVWEDTNPGGSGPWGQQVWHSYGGDYYYGVFWGGMPDLNYNSAGLKTEMFDIADYWLNEIGIDGFRLDAVRYIYEQGKEYSDLPQTISFWKEYSEEIHSLKEDVFSIGESWAETSKVVNYVKDDAIDVCFEFEISYAIIDAVNSRNSSSLYSAVQQAVDAYPHFQFSNFLTNHDQDRSFEVLGNNQSKSKAAASILMTLPGVPFMYYGEEIGMKGRKPDEYIRRPMQWESGANAGFSTTDPWIDLNSNFGTYNVNNQSNNENSILNHYRNLISLRNENKTLSIGDYFAIPTSSNQVYAFVREYEGDVVLVIQNLSSVSASDVVLEFNNFDMEQGTYTFNDLLTTENLNLDIDMLKSNEVNLTPLETKILRLNLDTSADDEISNFSVSISPNPTSSFIQLEVQDFIPEQILLIEVNGRILNELIPFKTDIIHSHENPLLLDISQVTAGMYFVKVIDKNGRSAVRKIVIQ